jgi:hypothetical protein
MTAADERDVSIIRDRFHATIYRVNTPKQRVSVKPHNAPTR